MPMAVDDNLKTKLDDLRKRIRRLDGALIAFSGGVDSSLLTRICREELGEKAVAVTARASNYPLSELSMAKRVAKIIGVKHVVYDPASHEREFHGSGHSRHGSNVYSSLKCMAMRLKLKSVIDASHRDDATDKGRRFMEARNAGIRSPLLESQLSKAEVRLLAKELGLPNWDQPSSCLRHAAAGRRRRGCRASRLAYGRHSGKEAEAQEYLSSLGLKASVVVAGRKATIVAGRHAMLSLLARFSGIRKKLKSMGLAEVLLRPLS